MLLSLVTYVQGHEICADALAEIPVCIVGFAQGVFFSQSNKSTDVVHSGHVFMTLSPASDALSTICDVSATRQNEPT